MTVSSLYPAPVVTTVHKKTSPFRLDIAGGNFLSGCTVRINNVAVPQTQMVSAGSLIAGSGRTLKQMCPKSVQVAVTVENPDGQISAAFPFTR